jgi:hypothetical protein
LEMLTMPSAWAFQSVAVAPPSLKKRADAPHAIALLRLRLDRPSRRSLHSARKSRRPMSDPPRWFSGAYRGQRCVGTGSSGRFVLPCVGPFLACAVLPAGAFAGSDLHPLESAALSTTEAIKPP